MEGYRAEDCLRRAVRLEPTNVLWEVNLAETLVAAGKPAQAREMLDSLTSAAGLSPALERRIRALRSSLHSIGRGGGLRGNDACFLGRLGVLFDYRPHDR